MTIFLSYSHHNEPEAEELVKKLEKLHIKCFMARRGLRGGDLFSDLIRQKIQECSEFFLLLTPQSIQSEWVISEWSAAWALRKTIVPILLNCARKDLPERLQSVHSRNYHETDRITKDYKQRQLDIAEEQKRQMNDPGRKRLREVTDAVESIVLHKLGSYTSIYDERIEHYKEEKLALAEKAADLIEARVAALSQAGHRKIRIFLDSGTTIAPLFNEFGSRATKEGSSSWLSRESGKVEIITNNIRGLQNLLRFRAAGSEHDRYAEIPFDCTVLPGSVLAVYQAIADARTILAVLYLARETDTYNISVVTGNYILYSGDGMLMPVARAGFHPEMKSVLYTVSDEVLVLAPLGKIVHGHHDGVKGLRQLLSNLNRDLGYSDKNGPPSGRPYRLIEKSLISKFMRPDEIQRFREEGLQLWPRKSVLITTARVESEHVFFPHYRALNESIETFEAGDATLTLTSRKFHNYQKGEGLRHKIK